ncbi:hypothetical protein SMACR_00667 [Sordaria macrospora]|uniref:WGS project CABT00000000 data, contig 2.2 n=2 Tax=Sordaria macrospora TaxID=5147 RepID=F7VMR3_SORMK|nr:uncharacterized protein SMAC_00667 [Sordaria macrospora k-hell]KAA8633895.1 hypothetical protein SMACR_00667 [Sordaria macrospora]KAH7630200.1 hypothetical protein B0T09DRAFT_321506 [Sordaria sp. MPI-SDFR-AT-0083]WPJ66872.1 hypothetical protein SMAC4_00667 [Sordaria macrospora]CCC06642.1 unnamed protein product [Sordaria macrospora k-hell]
MSSAAKTNLLHLYRAFLRELPPRPFLTTPRAPLHQRLRDFISSTGAPASAGATTPVHKPSVAEAEQLLAYLQAQREYVTLLERYNPGMGMDEETRVRLTAKRVGMDLPKEFKDGEEEK